MNTTLNIFVDRFPSGGSTNSALMSLIDGADIDLPMDEIRSLRYERWNEDELTIEGTLVGKPNGRFVSGNQSISIYFDWQNASHICLNGHIKPFIETKYFM